MRELAMLIGATAVAALAASAAYAFHGGGHAHGFHHHHHRGFWWPYGYVATYAPPLYDEPLPVFAAPAQRIPSFHCTKARETITVPAEEGGERQVTVTRCQ